jgi:hypothetical protein
MITIVIPHADPGYDDRRGPARWSETLSDAHYVWEEAGVDLRAFDGRRSEDCSARVAQLIKDIFDDPGRFIGACSYYDLRAVTANLTGLFFTLRERPDSIVHVRSA